MITYTDKVQLTPNPNPDVNQWKADDANEVKTEVNTDITNLATHVANTSNPHTVTATQVGLGNVDNTSDVNKPVSSATQTSLNGKQDVDSDLTTIAGLTPSNDDFLQRKSGAWANRSIVQVQSDLGIGGGTGTVTVTGTDTLDSSDFNKTILCSGTSTDYTVNLPTAVGNTGQIFDFVGVSALTKIVTVDANSTETINGIVTRAFTGRGGFKIVSDGANWQVLGERPSNILYTPTYTGFSSPPTNITTFSLLGKMMTIIYNISPGAASGTGLTFTIPSGFTIGATTYNYSRVQTAGAYVNTGMAEAGITGTIITIYTTAAGGTPASTSNKAANGQITFEIQ